MYSALSQSCRQWLLLLLTGLPVLNNLSDIQLTYSERYSGLLNGAPPIIIADSPYVTSLLVAFNSLLMDNYHAFILTVDLHISNILSCT